MKISTSFQIYVIIFGLTWFGTDDTRYFLVKHDLAQMICDIFWLNVIWHRWYAIFFS